MFVARKIRHQTSTTLNHLKQLPPVKEKISSTPVNSRIAQTMDARPCGERPLISTATYPDNEIAHLVDTSNLLSRASVEDLLRSSSNIGAKEQSINIQALDIRRVATVNLLGSVVGNAVPDRSCEDTDTISTD